MVEISNTGYWIGTELPHGVDRHLARYIKAFLLNEYDTKKHLSCLTVVDIGCGNGFYTKVINDTPSYTPLLCHGFDGNPDTYEVANVNCGVMDFSEPQYLLQTYDWALSLEVGEHIPQEFEQNFLDNVTRVKYGAILSWAVPGQDGDGHVNCRSNEYIIEQMSNRGFILDVKDTYYLRDNCAEYPHTGWWFQNSLMVFRKKEVKNYVDNILEEYSDLWEALADV